MRRLRPLLLLLPMLVGCDEDDSPPPGQVMVSIQTDMSLPKDVDLIRIEVTQLGRVVFSQEYPVTPAGPKIPATLAVTGDNAGPVKIRVLARQKGVLRVIRDAVTTVPKERIALLRMPIGWLCDGRATETKEGVSTGCPEGQTCEAGACVPEEVPEVSLPTFAPSAVYGGGTGSGDGACFDTVACFAKGSAPALSQGDCSLAVAATSETSVAIVTPPGETGICGPEACLVPLDQGLWKKDGDRIVLPATVCKRISEGKALGVAVTTACAPKTETLPTCGPWSAAGSGKGTFTDAAPPGAVPAGLIGPDGGSVASADGNVALSVPAGALAGTFGFSIAPALDAPAGHVGAAYRIGPDGTQFAPSATVTFEVDTAGGPSKDGLVVATLEGGAWKPLPPASADGTHVAATTPHLSVFGLVQTGTGGTGGGGAGGSAGGSGGKGGAGGAGSGGEGGISGQGGIAGLSGQGGTAGVSGQGGTAGASGQSGTAGQGGTAGLAGTGGTAGTAGTGGCVPTFVCGAPFECGDNVDDCGNVAQCGDTCLVGESCDEGKCVAGPLLEVCNGVDDNGDATVDEGTACANQYPSALDLQAFTCSGGACVTQCVAGSFDSDELAFNGCECVGTSCVDYGKGSATAVFATSENGEARFIVYHPDPAPVPYWTQRATRPWGGKGALLVGPFSDVTFAGPEANGSVVTFTDNWLATDIASLSPTPIDASGGPTTLALGTAPVLAPSVSPYAAWFTTEGGPHHVVFQGFATSWTSLLVPDTTGDPPAALAPSVIEGPAGPDLAYVGESGTLYLLQYELAIPKWTPKTAPSPATASTSVAPVFFPMPEPTLFWVSAANELCATTWETSSLDIVVASGCVPLPEAPKGISVAEHQQIGHVVWVDSAGLHGLAWQSGSWGAPASLGGADASVVPSAIVPPSLDGSDVHVYYSVKGELTHTRWTSVWTLVSSATIPGGAFPVRDVTTANYPLQPF